MTNNPYQPSNYSSGPQYGGGGYQHGPDPSVVQTPANVLLAFTIIWMVILGSMACFDLYCLVSDNVPVNRRGVDGRFVLIVRMTLSVIIIGVNILILKGAVNMKNLENYGMARTAGILSVIPCFAFCYIPGIGLGIWVLVVLARPEVKQMFRS